jgi:quercetin dioxygenase-like cupin family protein
MILLQDPKNGQEIDQTQSMYPTKMFAITETFTFYDNHCTMFGVVTSGKFEVSSQINEVSDIGQGYVAHTGNFMSMKTGVTCTPLEENSQMFAIIRYGFRGLETLGRIEDKGRLAYIDGCTDTLLVPPPRKGDACLNYLHFPKNIKQTQHLHPSIRMGVVINGHGVAFQENAWEHELRKGTMFCIPEGEVHSFSTGNSHMDIVAYHPDSDFGPTDENHPMLNKTLINHGTN